MDFEFSEKSQRIQAQVKSFIADHVAPRDPDFRRLVDDEGVFPPPFIDELKSKARAAGLWNLFLPGLKPDEPGTQMSNLDYAPCAEIMGRLPWSSEVFNCSAPDTGNMELLHLAATPAQKERWLKPLLEGRIRSSFAMTEPDVASSDATNIRTAITRARRRLGHQRAQMVHHQRRRSAHRDIHRHGPDQPRPPRAASPPEHGPGAARHGGHHRSCATRR